jgi:hypothetical protein
MAYGAFGEAEQGMEMGHSHKKDRAVGRKAGKAARDGDFAFLNRFGTLLAIAMLAAALPAGAQGESAPPPEVLVPNAVVVVVDRVAPQPGKATGPAKTSTVPVEFTYSGATDGEEGSGLKSVTLWMRNASSGVWASTDVSSTGASGTLSYSGFGSDGLYYYALRAEDEAGNLSPLPQGTGSGSIVLDRKPPIITIKGSANVIVEAGQAYVDAGATAKDDVDGDLTSKITVDNAVNTAVPGTYYVTYNVSDSAGNSATASRTVTVSRSYALTLTPPSRGSLQATPAPGANGKYAAGTVVTVRYTADPAAGCDVLAWTGATADAVSPELARVTMNEDKTVAVALARHTGTVVVDVTPDSAGWTLVDGNAVSRDGSGDATLTGVPTGTISIAYKPIADKTTPASQQALLAKKATVTFKGQYVDSAMAAVSLPAELQGYPGALVDCPIELSATKPLTSLHLQFAFDSNLAEAVQVVNGSVTSAWAPLTLTNAYGLVSVRGSGAPASTTSGTVAILKLRIKPSAPLGTWPLCFNAVTLNGGALGAERRDGSLIVSANRFLWGDVNNDGKVNDLDAAQILLRRVGLTAQLPAPWGERAAAVSAEAPSVIGSYDAGLILQRVAGGSAAFPADADGDGFGPDSGTVSPQSAQGPARVVTLPTAAEATAGAEISLPISIEQAGGILGFFAEVTFDAEAVEFLGAARGSLGAAWTAPLANVVQNRLLLAAAGGESLAGSGSIVVMNFRARKDLDAATPLFVLNTVELNDGLVPAKVVASGGAPALRSVSPKRGAEEGGTVVTLQGTNLAAVTEVRFGNEPAPWILYNAQSNHLLAVAPAGKGLVDLTAVSLAGSSRLGSAFEYFEPSVFLTLTPPSSVNAGATIEVPVWLSAADDARPTSVSFRLEFDRNLFAVQTVEGAAVPVIAGDAAQKAKKTVTAKMKGPGVMEVTVSGSPASQIQPGLLCTCRLVALGDVDDALGLIYISSTSAKGSGLTKELSVAQGAR